MNAKTVTVEYLPTDRVLIDGEILGYVIEVSLFSGSRTIYQVAWMHNGDTRKDYFDGFRLSVPQ